ncbi:MAG: TonB-dependent receptor plug domain-containing protein [Candidatus Binatia bacterium]
MKRFLPTNVLLVLLAVPLSAVDAQQEETLKPVVVTATRVEIPREEVTTSISVITAEDIQAQQAETVLEALRNVPGVDVIQSGSRGNNTSVFIRGSESDHVLVLIDGVEVNSTTLGSFRSFAHLTTESVERIEILRGAGGTLYGSQAIGGVIHIITRVGTGKPKISFSTEGGNSRTNRQVLALRGGTERLGYFLSASRMETDGFHRFNDDYQNLATSGRVDFQVTEGSSLKGIFHFRKTDLGLFNSNNFIPLPDPNARQNVTNYLVKMDWEQEILNPSWNYRFSTSLFKENDKFSDDPEPGSFDTRTRTRFRPRIITTDFQTNYRWRQWSTTTFGIEYRKRQATTESIRKDQRNLAYYLQEQLTLLDGRLFLVGGVRLDDHQAFGTELSPSASAAYVAKTGTKLRIGYSEGFKAPSLNELFFPPLPPCPAFGNPDLGPEKSWELNAGFEQDLFHGRVKLAATYFHKELRDLIEARPIPGALPFCSRGENVGRARFDGLEWRVNIKILSSLFLDANYTYLDWDTKDGRLLRRPRHRGNVSLNHTYEGFHVNLNANIVGNRDDREATDFTKNITKPGHVKVDLSSSYALPVGLPLVKELTLFGKIENLFNKKYEEADGFRARPLNFLFGIRGLFGRD